MLCRIARRLLLRDQRRELLVRPGFLLLSEAEVLDQRRDSAAVWRNANLVIDMK